MTRRDAIATFLSASAAALLPACGENTPARIDGEIIGASDSIGHKIRDGFRPIPSADEWTKADVVIVGGGVSGLSAARTLKRFGISDFVVLELEAAIGGTSRYGSSPVVNYPWGAHYIPAPRAENVQLVELLSEMGVVEGIDKSGRPRVGEQFLVRDPQERIFHKGKWQEGLYLRAGASAEDLRQFTAFKKEVDAWVEWRDGQGRRAFTIPMSQCSDDAHARALDTQSMSAWMTSKGFDSPRLRWYVEYACRDDYGALLADVSAWAGLFYFASRVEKAGDEAQPLIAWPEGNGKLVDHLTRGVSQNVRTSIAVTEILPGEAGARTKVIAFDQRAQKAMGFDAQYVIFAAPQFMAGALIRGYRQSTPYISEFQSGAWMVANLHLREHPQGAGFPICWDNVLYDSPSLGYVTATHQTEADRGPTVLTYYYPLCDTDPKQARAKLLAGDWKFWSDVALADLRLAHPNIRELTQHIDIMRWGHAMIRPRPGFLFGGAREKALHPFGNIHFAHTELSGMALFEEAFHHGIRAAQEVAVHRSLSLEGRGPT